MFKLSSNHSPQNHDHDDNDNLVMMVKIFIIILIIMVVVIAPIPFTTWHMSEDFVDDPILKFPH